MSDPDQFIQVEGNPPLYAPFLQAIGRAITSWQLVEEALCMLFAKVSSCQNEQVAFAIFHNFHDFSDKVDLVNCAARISLSANPEFLIWAGEKRKNSKAGLKNRLLEAAQLRNAIAHYQMATVLPGSPQIGVEGPKAFFAIQRYTGEGVVMGDTTRDWAKLPPGVHILLRPSATDPNLAFRGKTEWTKRPKRIRDVVKAANLFQSLIQDLNRYLASITPPPPVADIADKSPDGSDH
jgi:hypothetical protein